MINSIDLRLAAHGLYRELDDEEDPRLFLIMARREDGYRLDPKIVVGYMPYTNDDSAWSHWLDGYNAARDFYKV